MSSARLQASTCVGLHKSVYKTANPSQAKQNQAEYKHTKAGYHLHMRCMCGGLYLVSPRTGSLQRFPLSRPQSRKCCQVSISVLHLS